ncbi:lipopolysaccharide biosynthesis protein [Mesorhizobium sp. L48C026A00]|uniref:lipopolysaccharide biosynthesis protein n=1 Tax=Mesorhizobium sp. L48C026A00 TaxID=1287182 RepID=UPI0003CFCCCA|nr:lipopolysaccharide biosynthesis protein [Mesorhizobium sp. L48C026A00]ESZ10238.1 hypothetical protein X737_31865 [Mesorhizobium sp. L48C026A00]
MLKQRSFKAVIWSASDAFLRTGLQFVVSIALARLLTPEDFGTVALLYLFVGVAHVFVDGGFTSALIQKQDSTHADESTVFWFNLLMGAITASLLAAFAPLIADFYDAPILVPLARIVALSIFLNGLSALQITLLKKGLRFKLLLAVGGVSTFFSGTVAIVLAVKGYGVWALAAQTVTASAVLLLLVWILQGWRPTMKISISSARDLFGFSSYMLASRLLDVTYNRLYTLTIGRLYGVEEIGYYIRADNTKQLPTSLLSGVLSSVAYPTFATIGSDKARLLRGVRLAARIVMAINLPLMFGLIIVAKPVVVVLFGTQWLPCVPILQILCMAAVLMPLQVIYGNALLAQGHANVYFRIELTKKLFAILAIAVSSLYGVIWVAWAQVAISMISFTISALYIKRYLQYSLKGQFLDCFPPFGAAVAMASLVWLISDKLAGAPITSLILTTILGASLYAGVGWLFGLRSFNEVRGLLAERIGHRSSS